MEQLNFINHRYKNYFFFLFDAGLFIWTANQLLISLFYIIINGLSTKYNVRTSLQDKLVTPNNKEFLVFFFACHIKQQAESTLTYTTLSSHLQSSLIAAGCVGSAPPFHS